MHNLGQIINYRSVRPIARVCLFLSRPECGEYSAAPGRIVFVFHNSTSSFITCFRLLSARQRNIRDHQLNRFILTECLNDKTTDYDDGMQTVITYFSDWQMDSLPGCSVILYV